jgi:hypothetical protein
LVFGGLFVFSDLPTPPATADGLEHLAVQGTVLEEADDHGVARVEYLHPVTDQVVEEELHLWQPGRLPRVGEKADLVVSASDPRSVDLVGDDMPGTTNLPVYAMWVVAAAIPLGVRRFTVWRTERVARSSMKTFTMLAALGPPGRWRRRAVLHLYPLDAALGSRPVCSLPVLNTHRLPLGQILPVEVKGAPRPMGRVVARVGESVLWPARRALRSGSLPLPAAMAEPPYGLTEREPPTGVTWRPLWQRAVLPIVGVAASVVLLAVVAVVTHRNQEIAHRLERQGTSVVGTVIGHEDGDFTVVLRVRSGDQVTEVRAPADFANEFPEGRRFPIIVDPDDPKRGRLQAEPYDGTEPVLWAGFPLAVSGSWVLFELARWWRARSVVRSGPWWDAGVADHGGGLLVLDASGRAVSAIEGEAPLYLAGEPDPGGFTATFRGTGELEWAGVPRVPRTLPPAWVEPPSRGAWWRSSGRNV